MCCLAVPPCSDLGTLRFLRDTGRQQASVPSAPGRGTRREHLSSWVLAPETFPHRLWLIPHICDLTGLLLNLGPHAASSPFPPAHLPPASGQVHLRCFAPRLEFTPVATRGSTRLALFRTAAPQGPGVGAPCGSLDQNPGLCEAIGIFRTRANREGPPRTYPSWMRCPFFCHTSI